MACSRISVGRIGFGWIRQTKHAGWIGCWIRLEGRADGLEGSPFGRGLAFVGAGTFVKETCRFRGKTPAKLFRIYSGCTLILALSERNGKWGQICSITLYERRLYYKQFKNLTYFEKSVCISQFYSWFLYPVAYYSWA